MAAECCGSANCCEQTAERTPRRRYSEELRAASGADEARLKRILFGPPGFGIDSESTRHHFAPPRRKQRRTTGIPTNAHSGL